MRTRTGVTLAIAVGVIGIMSGVPRDLRAEGPGGAALSGSVGSSQEARMEGVVVSARRDGANFTVSVVSDAQGRYSFPRTHLEPGRYTLTIRAVGYDLVGPARVDVTAGAGNEGGCEAREGEGPRLPVELARMGDEHPGHVRAEGQARVPVGELRVLPHVGTHHEVEVHGRAVRAAHHPYADVLHGRDGGQPGRPRPRTTGHARSEDRRAAESDLGARAVRRSQERTGGVPRDGEPEWRPDDVAV